MLPLTFKVIVISLDFKRWNYLLGFKLFPIGTSSANILLICWKGFQSNSSNNGIFKFCKVDKFLVNFSRYSKSSMASTQISIYWPWLTWKEIYWNLNFAQSQRQHQGWIHCSSEIEIRFRLHFFFCLFFCIYASRCRKIQ